VKKSIALLVLVFYGLSTFGADLNFHYCCGKLDKINSINVTEKPCCKMAAARTENKRCCKEKNFSLKIKGEQTPANVLSGNQVAVPAIRNYSEFILSLHATPVNLVHEVFAPPPQNKDFNTFYCIFRI
jgi:hypothetical protein